jgi:ribosomal protein S18 acetylase RimI-like enzyme
VSALQTPTAALQRAIGDLRAAREAAAGWRDDQRETLDRSCLDPLEAQGRWLAQALMRAAAEIADAERLLVR